MENNEIEIPFGAKDSELVEATYYIPDGMEAIIEGDKVIIRKKESEDERIREELISLVLKAMGREKDNFNDENYDKMLDWLEKQSKENMIEALRLEYEKGKSDALQEQRKEWNEEDEKIRKSLVHLLQVGGYMSKEEKTKAFAWLEKQGKETSWKPSKEEMDVLYGLAYITNQYDEHKEEIITRLYQDLKREFFNGSSYENMFPNTEDGVRRRSTIQVLEYARSLDTYNQYGKADIDKNIAWLEKQGERDKFKDAIQIGDKVTRNRDGVLVNLSQLERVAKKETLYDKCRKEQPSHFCADITELGRCVVEHESKVEPKFKIRNWIVNNNSGYIYQVTDIRDDEYCLWPIDTEIEGYVKIIDVDNDYHLYIIEDAKDGDIIYIKRYGVNDEWLLIFKKIESQNNLINVYDYYAFCITSDNMYHGLTGDGCWGLLASDCDIVCPATKEQCNLLFAKMKEEGFEWDAKKKDLKKISQEYPLTPDECVKPAWSEEDEEKFRDVIRLIEQGAPVQSMREHYTNWLKSLKERLKGE